MGEGPGKTADATAPAVPHLELSAIPRIAKAIFRKTPASHPHKSVSAVIEDALRAAGLMK
jgi:hypothetical protein